MLALPTRADNAQAGPWHALTCPGIARPAIRAAPRGSAAADCVESSHERDDA